MEALLRLPVSFAAGQVYVQQSIDVRLVSGAAGAAQKAEAAYVAGVIP